MFTELGQKEQNKRMTKPISAGTDAATDPSLARPIVMEVGSQ